MHQDIEPDLAIVIPVRNLPEDLDRLLGQVASLGIFSQVIVSDDFSDEDCDLRNCTNFSKLTGADVFYLRSEQQHGAGHARNVGMEAVTASNVLFFDADDMLCDELIDIWYQHCEAGCPDFTIFRHNDTRVEENEGRRGTFLTEEQAWEKALSGDSVRMLNLQQCAELIMISAYPWNKIYRTDFLRTHNILCSETPVHNDVRLHWLSFLYAENVQASRRIGAVHIIGDRSHHLTERKGRERLCLGGILAELTDRIREVPGRLIVMQRFIQFVDAICRWNLLQVELELVPEFRNLACEAYLGFTAREFRVFAVHRPDDAKNIIDFLLAQGA